MTKPQEDGPDVAGLLPALAQLPRPELPPEVAARLDAAIMRAVAERAASPTGSQSAEAVSGPVRASSGLRRHFSRVRLGALSAVTACVVAILAVVLSFHPAASPQSNGPMAANRGGASALSTAPVTDPALLSWAASALREHAGPLTAHSGGPGAQSEVGPSDPALACLPNSLLNPAGAAPRKLLTSIAGQYEDQSTELAVYTNGDDSTTAFIVVFAVPCQTADATVLASGIVPR